MAITLEAYLEKKNIPLISPLTELTILETSLTNRGVTAYFVAASSSIGVLKRL
mgnify:CR=1 FL=1